jgi:predicted acylesterase/phospholipase RssA
MNRTPSFMGPVPASHNGLLERLLDVVRSYHHTRRTGLHTAHHEDVEEVDIVCSGGGMKGYFVTGAYAVLAGMRSLRVVRMAGASAGAWCAVFMACGVSPILWSDTYYMTRLRTRDGLSIADAYRTIREDILPADAYLKCSKWCARACE